MAKPAACVACRQNKLRCNASATYPSSCSRCAGRNLACRIDTNYKRIPTRNRVEQLAKELDRLKAGIQKQQQPTDSDSWSNHAVPSQSSVSGGFALSPTESRPEDLSTPCGAPDPLFKLEDFAVSNEDVNEAFQEYYRRYHHQLPVLDDEVDPTAIFDASPILFWTIIFVASKNMPSRQSHYSILCKKIPALLGNLMVVRHNSVHTLQALLILTAWPAPVQRQSEDMRWIYSGLTLQIALQGGYHRVGYEHEYYSAADSGSTSDERVHIRLWRFWCFLNALLSCELGLPCLIPSDALEITTRDESALPSDFVPKLRISLYVCRINDLSNSTSNDSRQWMHIARTLERDLKSMSSGLRNNSALWNPSLEFVYLCVLLNLYSISLRCTSSLTPSDPDLAVIQSSAAQTACRMIDIFANSLMSNDETISYPQRYLAKFYRQFHTIALLMLPKMSALNRISLQQLGELDNAGRLGHSALMSCSSSRADEAHRAAVVVEILYKKGVVSSTSSNYPVHSRLGASLWLEQLATAVRWRQRYLNKDPKSIASDAPGSADVSINHKENNTRLSSMDGALIAMVGAHQETAGMDTTCMSLSDAQGIDNLPASFVGDWTVYLDAVESDFGAAYGSTWWGGMEMFGS